MKKLCCRVCSGCCKPEASLVPMAVAEELVPATKFEEAFTTKAEDELSGRSEKASTASVRICRLK